jgi:hypothetical protein
MNPGYAVLLLLIMLMILVAGGVFVDRLAEALGGSDPAPAAQGEPAGPTPELQQIDLAAADPVPECGKQIISSIVTPTRALAAVIRDSRLQYSVIAPAVAARGGASLHVRTSYRVSCALDTGIVGHRGGFRLARGQRFADFRRLRINMARNLIRMFSSSTEQQGYQGLTCDLKRATLTDLGGGRQIMEVPLLLTPEGVVAINVGLGIDGFRPGDTIAILRMTTQEIA